MRLTSPFRDRSGERARPEPARRVLTNRERRVRVGARLALPVVLLLATAPAAPAASAAGSPALDSMATAGEISAEARLSGSGPVTAWLGGAAKRTYALTITNHGAERSAKPDVVVTVGKGRNPQNLLARPDIKPIEPGETVRYELPVTLAAPAFGTYHVKATVTVGERPATVVASTSSYPWLLFGIGWLLLQPLLLGLYKRRPTRSAEDDELLLEPVGPPAEQLTPELVAPGLAYADAAGDAGTLDLSQYPPPYAPEYEVPLAQPEPYAQTAPYTGTEQYPPTQSYAATEHYVSAEQHAQPYVEQPRPDPQTYAPQPVAIDPLTDPSFAEPPVAPVDPYAQQYSDPYVQQQYAQTQYVQPAPAPAPAADPVAPSTYRPVFGVRDMRTYLDPAASPEPALPPPPARVVLGGVVVARSAPTPDEPATP